MIRTHLFTAFSRHLVRHPWQLFLALLGITVGVAVIIAIRLTQYSAIDAFDTATRMTVGNATHRLIARQGILSHETIRRFATTFPTLSISPVLSQTLSLVEHPGQTIDMIGIEPLTWAREANQEASAMPALDVPTLMSVARGGVINSPTANELGLDIGSQLTVRTGRKSATLSIIQILPKVDSVGGVISDVIIVDVASAQEILERFDGVAHANLRLSEAQTISSIEAFIAKHYAGDLELVDLAAESRNVKRLTAAFYSNLNALSLMALLVGMFLIYNTETFLVLQRRQMIGRLRALGASRRQLLGAILVEASAIGGLGSLCGIALGVVLAGGLLGVVSTTINDLYFNAPIEALAISPQTLAYGVLIGVSSTIFAALVPALSATRIEPSLVISRTRLAMTTNRLIWTVAVGVFIFGNLAAWQILVHSQSPNAGFAGISFVVVAFSALCPITIMALSSTCHRIVGKWHLLPERLGLSAVKASINRTGTAAAALMIATAASIGIGIMVISFRVSVSDWLDTALRADLYVADSEFNNQARAKKISPSVIDRISNIRGVSSTTDVLRRDMRVENVSLRLSAFTLNETAKKGFRFTHGNTASIWPVWDTQDVAIITEPYAYHNNIALEDTLELPTDHGIENFKVIGIYQDYASERGSVSISRPTYDRHWSTSGYDGIGIYSDGAATDNELAAAVSTELGEDTNLVVKSTKELKHNSLEVFDRTFLITELLRAIAVVVSFIGVLGALLAQQLERTQEYGILRATGFRTLEIVRVVLTQTMLLGATAAVIAIPVGILIGIILIEVVNPRSFGWSMTMLVPTALIVKSCAVALLAAFIAGLYPSLRAARIEPADAMRYE